MATIVTAAVPCDEFALSTTLKAVPDAAFRCETVVETGENAVMPLVWARAHDFDALDDALRDDPSVANVTALSTFDDKRLYRMEWVDRIHLLMHMLVNERAVVLDASTDDDHWTLRMLHPERENTEELVGFCESHGLSLDVRLIRELDSEPASRYGLTDEQYRSLRLAHERGYYRIPRDSTLDDLSAELGISHQALSERLRRGTDALIEDTIAFDPLPAHDADPSNPQ